MTDKTHWRKTESRFLARKPLIRAIRGLQLGEQLLMCRIFALRSSAPRSVYDSLFGGEHSLKNQSCGDSRKECHGDGWGIGHYNEDRAERVRSPRPAAEDPLYRQLAESLQARTLLAHVRQASMGNVAERNCHPFVYSRWMVAHNGTVVGFPAVREELRASLPLEFREHIQGDTDSEHAFFLILTRLEQMLGTLEAPAPVEVLREVLASTIRSLEEHCPAREISRRDSTSCSQTARAWSPRAGDTPCFGRKSLSMARKRFTSPRSRRWRGNGRKCPRGLLFAWMRGWIAVSGSRTANVAMGKHC